MSTGGVPAAPPSDALSPTGRVGVGLASVLRGAGLEVPIGAVIEFTKALGLVGLGDLATVYFTGRATLVTRPEDLALYDRCFSAFFTSTAPGSPLTVAEQQVERHFAGFDGPTTDDALEGESREGLARYSARELLRERDFATLSQAERVEAAALLAEIRFSPHERVTRRRETTSQRDRRPDLRAVVRRSVRRGGELRIDRYLTSVVRPRRVVLLLDVSGSMEAYSRELLRFAQVAVRARPQVEVFTLGTRLTRVTRELAATDADRALQSSVAAIPDLSGGTRLGEALGHFNSEYGVRGLARGAVVVICSDGIDRGDPEQLADELERLRRVAHLLLWVNPLKASEGYAPIARGMAAALPHVDGFLEGHSVGALADLAAVISRKAAGHRRR